MRENVVPILIPVYNTPPRTLLLVVSYLYGSTRNPVVIVNDGSSSEETIKALDCLRRSGYAIVIDKKNGGKIDALIFGLEYVVKQFNPRCVFIMDDDIIPYSMKSESLDNLLRDKCSILSDSVPVIVFPVANQAYLRENISKIAGSNDQACSVELSAASHYSKPNILDYIQSIEHIVASNHARLIARSGLWVGGSGSLWLVMELKELLRRHSKEHAADDLELSVLLLRSGKGIGFSNDLTLYAELVSKPLKFLKQRIYWSYGALRVLMNYPDILLPRKGSSPLYTMYILSAYVFLAILMLPLPIILKEILGVLYGSLVLTQIPVTTRKNCIRIFVLIGGIFASTVTLASAIIVRLLTGNHEVASHIMLLGAVSSLIYTLTILHRANNSQDNYLRLRTIDLLALTLYAFIYNLVIMPAGSLLYIYRTVKRTRSTYKVT